ncbi:thioredoxin [Tannerella sp. oral taxon BU063 isolate Cell 5]|uniref:Thioredoxin n=1 Tax=Tannerella sp. oral taxon BU063 isolate Cell 5 TaxID=1410950 RepID=W2C928_9BACT|nr:thioredoxin [Tannerella sp. oral taxon BU063 isolate Cell 5]
MSVVNVSDANYKEVLAAGQPVVLDFWAEWCGPCRMVSPIIDELAEEYAGRITVGKVNVDENDTAVAEYGIRNIPTVLFFKDGQVVDKQVGVAQKAAFVEKMNKLL